MEIGYYAHKFTSTESVNINPGKGKRTEIGFAVLPVIQSRNLDASAKFGMARLDLNDDYLHPGYKKGKWSPNEWDGTSVDQAGWFDFLQEARDRGEIELPIAAEHPWETDNNAQITQAELDTLATMMRDFFDADPATKYWELGIEENLGDEENKAYFWPNLQKNSKR